MDFSGLAIVQHMQQNDIYDRYIHSLETAEELRRRLAKISTYYENLVRRMQDDLVEEKAKRSRIQTAMAKYLSNISPGPKVRSWDDVQKTHSM